MNLRDLNYLITLAETQHFGVAAERCFVSQPTLSTQIKKLEDELGLAVFERTKRSVKLTAVGQKIIGQARKVLEQVDALEHMAQHYQDPLAGPLRLGIIPTISPNVTPSILEPIKQHYPAMALVLAEEFTDVLVQRLLDHEIDAALIATSEENEQLESLLLYDEPFWLAYPKGHPAAGKRQFKQDDLENMELLLLAEGHCLADQAMDVCQLHDRVTVEALADLRAASLETLLHMVNAGLGSTLLPALAVSSARKTHSNINLRELKLPDTYRRIQLVCRKSFPRKEALHAFASVLMKSLPDKNRIRPIAQN